MLLVRKEGLDLNNDGDEFCHGSSSVNVGMDRVNVRSNKVDIDLDDDAGDEFWHFWCK